VAAVIVVPAIDLLGGKAVRLRAGRREDATVYHEDPSAVAAQFARAGASRIHVVDLDGAFAGVRQHAGVVQKIVAAGVPVQLGGGVRDAAAVDAVLAAGAALVVLGTAAVKDPAFVERACAEHRGRVVVAVDARDGHVAVEGWTETSSVDAVELARRAAGWGAAKILYTDVSRDGLRGGPNVAATARLQQALGDVPVIASGGIGALDDLRALAAAGVAECVVGRALYDGVFTLEEALRAC
jgi:phosphoribosylformimino-5-aminoimidazole carboxamide ribotide isomerase